jgi:hypothetical protein
MRHLLILLGIAISLNSCSGDKSNRIVDNLIGTWTLDSISTPSGGFFANKDSKSLIFKNKTDYSYEWWNGDVGNTFTGKFFILDNPKRGLKTLTCIPDIQVSGKDTIRIEYMNLDIVNLQKNRLVLIDETKWIDRDSLPSLRFNEVQIYKRKRQPKSEKD